MTDQDRHRGRCLIPGRLVACVAAASRHLPRSRTQDRPTVATSDDWAVVLVRGHTMTRRHVRWAVLAGVAVLVAGVATFGPSGSGATGQSSDDVVRYVGKQRSDLGAP